MAKGDLSYIKSLFSSGGYPNHEFWQVAKKLNCSFVDVVEAFSPSDFFQVVDQANFKSRSRRWRIEAALSEWRIQFGIRDPQRIATDAKIKKDREDAAAATDTLLKCLAQMERDAPKRVAEILQSDGVPSIEDIERLRDRLKVISNWKANARPDIDFLAAGLARLFDHLDLKVSAGSASNKSSVYAKTLAFVCETFGYAKGQHYFKAAKKVADKRKPKPLSQKNIKF